MKKKLSLLLAMALIFALFACGANEGPTEPVDTQPSTDEQVEPEPETVPEPEPEPPAPVVATLAVCGDVMSHMPLTNDTWDETLQRYNYARVMEAAEPYVSAADYAVANLETTFSGGPPYSGYPAFNTPDDLATDLKAMGFDLMMTCNNHSLDRGKKGLLRTLDTLDGVGLAHVGTSRTQEECDNNIQVVDVGGISVAFLAYTYGTNGIPVPSDAPYVINLFNVDYLTNLSQLDTARIEADMAKAREMGTDLIAVMIHWGWEYHTKQNDYQDSLAQLLFANGADLVLGGHSHVPQPMELKTVQRADGSEDTGFVCYSLGNFISAQNDHLTDTTAVLTVELTKDMVTGETDVTGYSYRPMLMLDREGGENRFELLDVHAQLEREDLSESMRKKLLQTLEDCHAIWGAEFDPLAEMPEETPMEEAADGEIPADTESGEKSA